MKKLNFKAEIVADSISPAGHRLTTFVVVFPRMILAEFNTHRMLSRNSASSRAIPFETMLKRVKESPFIPIKWMKDHKGMQGNEYFNSVSSASIEEDWLIALDNAIKIAEKMSHGGLTKQIVNRLLEPFMWHTVIVTATDWQNFFALRAHDAAEIHMQKIAYMMLDAYNESKPKLLGNEEWHIPFGGNIGYVRIQEDLPGMNASWEVDMAKIKIATARCARVSYTNYEGNDDYVADIKLHDNLVNMGHWSPFEHCAQVVSDIGNGYSGNFQGFVQYRKTFETENKIDTRITLK